MQTATRMTFYRIFSAPVFFIIYFMPVWLKDYSFLFPLSVYIMLPLLAFAEFTDYLDGKFARLHNQVSNFGKVFDPFADVFLNITVFFFFLLSAYMPGTILLLILYREISMFFIRLVAIQEGVAIGARKGGKIKTVLYVSSYNLAIIIESALRLGLLNTGDALVQTGKTICFVLFIICLGVSYLSFADYLYCFRKILMKKD
jgi:CDP-diacylglycerol--glycerol-3-phosphate 3-phosphatidyltransferase